MRRRRRRSRFYESLAAAPYAVERDACVRRSLLFNNKMTAVVDGFPTITRAIDENTQRTERPVAAAVAVLCVGNKNTNRNSARMRAVYRV